MAEPTGEPVPEDAVQRSRDYLNAFIRTAQYIPNLTTRQDILSETGRVLISFFKANLVGFFEPGKDGRIESHHWILPEGVPGTAILTKETETIITGVLETGFLAAQQIAVPEPFATVFLPITWENQTAAVMLVGHRTSDPLPKELLNIYLAVAGLVSNAINGADEEFKNIAAIKRTEEALKEARAQLAFLVSNTPVVLYRFSVSGDFNVTFISDNVRLQLGYEAHEFTDDPAFWPDHIHPDDRKHIFDGLSRLIKKGTTTTTSEYRFLAKDGTYRWLRDEVRVVRDANGQPVEYLGYWIDITERKKMEAALSAIAREWEITFNATSDAICLIDADQKIQRCNSQMSKILGGIPQGKIVGMPCWAIVHKTTGPIPECPFVSAKKTLYRTKLELPAGNLWFEVTADPIVNSSGKFTGAVHIMRDITARKQAEEALRLQNRIFETIAEGVYLIRVRDGVIVYTNAKFEIMFGYEKGELIGKHVSMVNAPEGERGPQDTAEEIMKALNEKGNWRGEIKNIKKDGTTFWCLAVVSTFEHPEFGSVWISAHTDITARKQAEEAVQAAVKLNQMIDTMSISESMGYTLDEAERLTTSRIGFFHLINPDEETIQLIAWSTETKKHCFIPKEPERHYPVSKAGVWVDCIRERKPVIHNDYASLHDKKGLPEGHVPVIRELTVPIFDEDRIVAIIGVGNKPTDYDEKDINVLTLLAKNAWTLIQRKHAEEEQERIRLWQAGVNRILESVLAPISLDQKLKIITDGVVETFGADFCRIWLIEKGDLCNAGCMHAKVTEGPHICRLRDKCLHLKASSGRYTHIDGKAHRRVPFGAYKIGRIASGEETKFLTNDVEHDPRVHDPEWAKSLGLVAFAGYRLKPPDGEVLGVFALFTRFPITPDMDAILDGLSRAISLAIQKDIAEAALHESREMYRELIENINDVIFSLDLQGKFTYISPVIERLYGYHPDEVIGQHFTKFLHPDDHPQCIEAFKKRLKGEYGINNFKIRCRDGREENVCVSQRPMIKDGVVTGFNYIMSNITARKLAEDALRTSEERFRTMIEQSPLSIEVMSPDGRTLQVNPAFVKLWGVTLEDLKDYNMLRDEQLISLGIMPYIQRGFSGEAVAYPPLEYDGARTLGFGDKKWVQGSIYPVRDAAGTIRNVILVHEDITEQKTAEEALRESEKRYRDMFELNNAVMLIIDPDNGMILDANSSACRYYGYDKDEITGMVITDINIADPSFTRKNMSHAIGNHGAAFNFQHRKKNGEIRDVEVFSAPVILGGHRLLHSIIQDVTERKRVEKALIESEQWFHDIFNNITDAILLHEIGSDGRPGRFTDVNDVACRMLEYTREEMLTKTPLDITTDYHNPPLEKIFEEQRRAGTARFETEYRTKDGTIIPVEVNTHVVTILRKKLMLGDARDITDRKKAEEEERLTRDRFETLVKVSEMRNVSETELSEYVMEAACRMTGSTLAFIGTMTPDESVMDLISWSKSTMQDCRVAASPIHFPVQRAGIWADAIRTHKPKIVNDYSIPHPGKKGLPEGHVRIMRFLSLPILDNGNVVMVAAVANKPSDYDDADVTRLTLLMQGVWGNLQKRRSEEALKMSEQKFRDIFNNTTDAIHIHGINDDGTPGKFTDLNDVACRMLGYTREEMLAKTPLDITTGYHNPPIDQVFEEQRTTGTARFETEHREKDGTIIPVEVNTHVVTIQGTKVMLGVVRDITERKKAEALLKHFNEELEQEVKVRTEELKASLDEKVLLLREIHHRVKNNLQIIISLVNLQMRQIDDERLKQVMAETQNRVRAMAFVHEKLFQSEDISRIDLANYTRFLVTQLFSFYGIDSRQVTLNVDIGKLMLNINTAIPLGLIINELASNTLKHAFPNGRTGSLSITVREEDTTLYLTVKDDGVGIPEDFDWRNAESLGLRLVISLVEQLDGTIELDRSAGTAFTIVVKEKE